MATDIKPEVSYNNKYWIPRHRYYELKHFCLQYNDWVLYLSELDGMNPKSSPAIAKRNGSGYIDPTAWVAIRRAYFQSRIDLVNKAAREADQDLSEYILESVIYGSTYNKLRCVNNIPCCRDVFYELRRKFFWILDDLRQ